MSDADELVGNFTKAYDANVSYQLHNDQVIGVTNNLKLVNEGVRVIFYLTLFN